MPVRAIERSGTRAGDQLEVCAETVWLLGLGVLGALVIRAIRQARSPGRSLALITLLAVVANP